MPSCSTLCLTPRTDWCVHTSVRHCDQRLLQLYVPWNVHEQRPGNFTWTGFADLERFLAIARDLKLLVLLRPGPYMCARLLISRPSLSSGAPSRQQG